MSKSKQNNIRSVKKRTSIGNSNRSRPKNKSARNSTKPYRGQGK